MTNIIGLLLGALTALSIFVSGCQPASIEQINKARQALGYESDQPKVEVTVGAIGGSWFGACVRDTERSEFYKLDQVEVGTSGIRVNTKYFSDSNCNSRSFEENFVGTFELLDEKISIKYVALDFMPNASIIVASLNIAGFCGKKDWEIDKIKSFPDVDSCGYSPSAEMKIARYGSDELFLNGRKLVLSKKTTELLDQ